MTVYVDSDFLCHVSDSEGLYPVEADFFDGKSPTFIEGYRCIPKGKTWARSDGAVFNGLMIAPAVQPDSLIVAQAEYERGQIAMQKAYRKGVDSV